MLDAFEEIIDYEINEMKEKINKLEKNIKNANKEIEKRDKERNVKPISDLRTSKPKK